MYSPSNSKIDDIIKDSKLPPYKNQTSVLFSSTSTKPNQMSCRKTSMGLTASGLMVLLLAMNWSEVTAQSDCTSVLISLAPCLDYITGNSTTPSSSCCTQLTTVVGTRPQCLCEILNNGGSSLGLSINQTQALALPGACNVQTPPVSRCNAAAPSESPSNSVPTGGGSNSGASNIHSTEVAVPLFFVFLLIASYASIYTIA